MKNRLLFLWPQQHGLVVGSHLVGVSVILLFLANSMASGAKGLSAVEFLVLSGLIVLQLLSHRWLVALNKRLQNSLPPL